MSRILVITSGNTLGEAMQVMSIHTTSFLFARIEIVSTCWDKEENILRMAGLLLRQLETALGKAAISFSIGLKKASLSETKLNTEWYWSISSIGRRHRYIHR